MRGGQNRIIIVLKPFFHHSFPLLVMIKMNLLLAKMVLYIRKREGVDLKISADEPLNDVTLYVYCVYVCVLNVTSLSLFRF